MQHDRFGDVMNQAGSDALSGSVMPQQRPKKRGGSETMQNDCETKKPHIYR